MGGMFDFTGRRVLVTGASRGLGLEIARAFADAGATVMKAGRLIFVTSIAASIARAPDPAYTASKGGLDALTRSLAVEFGADNLTVNAIAPGWFATEPNRYLSEDKTVQAFVDVRIPLKRWGRPEELAPAALFLAAPASSFVNGVTLTVDGGMSAQM